MAVELLTMLSSEMSNTYLVEEETAYYCYKILVVDFKRLILFLVWIDVIILNTSNVRLKIDLRNIETVIDCTQSDYWTSNNC